MQKKAFDKIQKKKLKIFFKCQENKRKIPVSFKTPSYPVSPPAPSGIISVANVQFPSREILCEIERFSPPTLPPPSKRHLLFCI